MNVNKSKELKRINIRPSNNKSFKSVNSIHCLWISSHKNHLKRQFEMSLMLDLIIVDSTCRRAVTFLLM